MRKKVLILLLTAASSEVLAAEQAYPDIPAYEAYGVKAPLSERVNYSMPWIKNIYITGKIGIAYEDVSTIENLSAPTDPTVGIPPVVSDSTSGSTTQWGVALGYIFKPTGLFSRFEIEYMNRGTLDYNADPLLSYPSFVVPTPLTSVSSTIRNQTILGKIYYDIDLNTPIVPYLQAGGGYSWTKVEATGSIENDPITGATVSNSSETRSTFAIDAGLGFRFKLASHVLVDLGYEFDYLGDDLAWTLQTDLPDNPVILQSGSFYANTINLGITFVG